MQFVDEVYIKAKAGDGGAGSHHYRREKFVPRGGPDGGDGGAGGSIVLLATHGKRTLLDFRFKAHWEAKDGAPGGTNRRYGKGGSDVVLEVPVGTEIYLTSEDGSEEFIADLSSDGQKQVLAKGGIGGKGNWHFRTSTNQAPQYAQPGLPGTGGRFRLSLKLLADVGLLGLPNAGKSTFLSRVSAAKPKIADYPFTTREPQLGIVQLREGRSCAIADIPGLIEGAHIGKGLGIQFLKHVERTGILLHLVDLSPLLLPEGEVQVADEIKVIEHEIQEFSEQLGKKKRALVFTKQDVLASETELDLESVVSEICKDRTIPHFIISSVTGAGMTPCLDWVMKSLAPPEAELTPDSEYLGTETE